MWWRGARVPLFVWIGLLAAFTWLKLTLILDDYEFQMLGTKALAATWDFIGLDEMKRANVTSSSVRPPASWVVRTTSTRL